MKNSYLVILASLIMIIPLTFIIKFGISPRPKPVIKPSNFESYEEVGKVLFSQLARDIEKHPIVAIGISNSNDLKVVDGFVIQSIKAKKYFDEAIVLTNQRALFDIPTENMPYESRDNVIEYLDKKMSYGQKIILVVQNSDTPHFQKNSFVSNLEMKDKVLSITAMRGSTNPEELKKGCGGAGYQNGIIQIDCIAYQQSIKIYKKADRSKNMISAERYGLRDYVFTVIEVEL